MFPFLLAVRRIVRRSVSWPVARRVADDAQEFIHTKLPHLLVVAAIAFVSSEYCEPSPLT